MQVGNAEVFEVVIMQMAGIALGPLLSLRLMASSVSFTPGSAIMALQAYAGVCV
jgi:hypothetical protein